MTVYWPPFKECTFLVLHEGPGDGVRLDVAPTMKTIVYQGERYFRMSNARTADEGGELRGGSYLWGAWRP